MEDTHAEETQTRKFRPVSLSPGLRRQRFGWTVDEAMSFKLLDGFVAAGFNLIDTADSYSKWAPGNKGGESETIIGNWLKQRGNREKVII